RKTAPLPSIYPLTTPLQHPFPPQITSKTQPNISNHSTKPLFRLINSESKRLKDENRGNKPAKNKRRQDLLAAFLSFMIPVKHFMRSAKLPQLHQ
ncbi:hypothetical protein, partial [Pseudochrobactrum saccharolyticum]|uniref:hypothetical protein n=1 Tax=Pseudochrobactrum saccharolyticum TaxID=354352 RepID=UPI002795F019